MKGKFEIIGNMYKRLQLNYNSFASLLEKYANYAQNSARYCTGITCDEQSNLKYHYVLLENGLAKIKSSSYDGILLSSSPLLIYELVYFIVGLIGGD